MGRRRRISRPYDSTGKGQHPRAVEYLEPRELLAVVVNGPFSGIEGQFVSNQSGSSSPQILVGTFTSSDVTGPSTDFSAAINWGDGTVTGGIITPEANGTTFDVSGSHVYTAASQPTFPVNIEVTGENGAAGSLQPGLASISAPLASTGFNLTEAKNASFSAVVANFHDTFQATASKQSEFSAFINWGDGSTPTSGIVVPDGQGGYNVIGASHTYTSSGTFSVVVQIFEQSTGAVPQTAAVTTIAVPSVPGTLAPISQLIIGNAGVPLSQGNPPPIIGAFVDNIRSYPLGAGVTPPVFNALINWGDGHTSLGTVSEVGTTSEWVVNGSNTYALPGSYPVNVTVQDQNGNAALIKSTADVTSGSSTVTATPTTFTFTPLVPLAGSTVVATFTDSNPLATSANTTASINWGDGHTTLGTITGPVNGLYTVTGSNIYGLNTPARVTVNVTITDPSGQTGTAVDTAILSAATTVTATGASIVFTPGVALPTNTVVATFTDTNPLATSTNTIASIGWGDGHTSLGTITGPVNGLFTVTGTNTYGPNTPSRVSVNVAITDPSGESATAVATALLGTASSVTASGSTFAFTPLVPLPATTVVATFTDTNPLATSSNTAASINWGDGHTTLGTITGPVNGLFVVTGANTYGLNTPARVSVDVTITDPSGQPASTVATAILNATSTVSATGDTFAFTPGVPLPSGTIVSTFTDSNPLATSSNTTATINWGDGHTSLGTITGPDKNGLFTVTGTNTYASTTSGNVPVKVTITDPSGESAVASATAILSQSAFQVHAINITAIPGVPFTLPVAAFVDPNPLALSTKPTAVISWGDGSSSIGNVTGPDANGVFTVTGSYNYFNASPNSTNTYPLSVTITDPSGLSMTATAVATVAAAPGPEGAAPIFAGTLSTGGMNSSNDEPTFVGVSNPFAIVQLYARYGGVDATIPLGQTVAGAQGQWSLLTGPLAPGPYLVTAIVTPAGGSPSSPFLMGTTGLVIVDTTPPRVFSVTTITNGAQTRVVIDFEDDLSGLSLATLQNAANYTLSGPGLRSFHPASVSLTPNVAGGLAPRFQQVVLTIDGSPRFRSRVKSLRLNGAGITDNAGNTLGGNKVVPLKPTPVPRGHKR